MDLASAWARCAPWVQAALDDAGNTHTLDDIKALIEQGKCQLWLGEASALVTDIMDWPQERALLLWLAGGDLDELRGVLRPQAEDFGKRIGCRRSMIIGRQGWARALKEHGYEPMAWICGKELVQ